MVAYLTPRKVFEGKLSFVEDNGAENANKHEVTLFYANVNKENEIFSDEKI